jgi:hypothetical protein
VYLNFPTYMISRITWQPFHDPSQH